MDKRIFIEKAKKIHGNKYDYSKVEYVNTKTKVCIICPEHGEFWQTPSNHLYQKQNCPFCSHRSYKKNVNEFIEEAKKIHNNKYDYKLVEYKNEKEKIKIICQKHGEFLQSPEKHLRGQGCPKCNKTNKKTTKDFIVLAEKKHNNKYDYSKVLYKNTETKVCIICKKHGEFWQTPHSHLKGNGCPFCSKTLKKNKHVFIEESNKIFNCKYDYSKIKYVNNKTKICIKCPEHGEFWKSPEAHLIQKQGCPDCSRKINVSETELFESIKECIKEHKITREKTFNWLGKKRIDIFIEDLNIGIEYQGRQHFEPVEIFGGIKGYLDTIERDKEKYEQCKIHGIKLLYFSNEKKIPDDYFQTIYNNKYDLLKKIIENDKNN